MRNIRNTTILAVSASSLLTAVSIAVAQDWEQTNAQDDEWAIYYEAAPVIEVEDLSNTTPQAVREPDEEYNFGSGIVKWCEKDGEGVRYTTENISAAGFERCGKLQTIAMCDAGGNKIYIKPGTKLPEVYKPCDIGPRIQISRTIEHSPRVKAVAATTLQRERDEAHEDPELARVYDEYLDSLDSIMDLSRNRSGHSKQRTRRNAAAPDQLMQQVQGLLNQLGNIGANGSGALLGGPGRLDLNELFDDQ